MADPVALRVEGADELRRELRRIGDDDLKKQLAHANKTAAEIVVDAALPDVPVDSGRLRASVRALGSQRAGRAVAGGARVPYASAIHWGRLRGNVGRPPGNRPGNNSIRARPFLYDAARRVEGRIYDTYEQYIERLLDNVRRRS